jgi:hypothetical protein
MIKDDLYLADNSTTPLVIPFTWEEVKNKEAKPGWLWFILLFIPWTDIYSSVEDARICALVTLDGKGCYQYKRFGDHSYNVRITPSPGFLGN